VLGAGVLALPWLSGLASRFLLDSEQPQLAIVLGDFAAAIDPREHPWALAACCVGLVLLPRFFRNGRMGFAPGSRNPHGDSCHEAAVLSGAARPRAWLLKEPGRLRRMLGRFVLIGTLAATNLTPALLFSFAVDRKTLGPALLELAGGDAVARSQAAALALTALFANLAAIAAAHWTRALPLARDLV